MQKMQRNKQNMQYGICRTGTYPFLNMQNMQYNMKKYAYKHAK
jgi:hypothetical protein